MGGETTFQEYCQSLEDILTSNARSEILDYFCSAKTLTDALAKMRSSMRAHTFKTKSGQISLARIVRALDERTKQDGFTVLIDWDGKANRWLDEMIPVDVLDYFARGVDPVKIGVSERQSLSILLDFYFMYVLALFAMRVGDEGDTPQNVESVTGLIGFLQGSQGSGQRNLDDTGALILVATAHFEPDASAYERLIARIRTGWSEAQQIRFALLHAAILGSHLRHGFQDLYVRDLGLMRDDNGPDYPCLCFALLTLMQAYARMHEQNIQGIEREKIVEGLLNGLTPDPRAFIGKPPAPLANYLADQSRIAELFVKYHADLFQEFEAHRPSETFYSPIAFGFNFPHNLVKGMVIDALFKAQPSRVSLNDLLTGVPKSRDGKEDLTRTLMGYARRVPDKIGGRAVPVIYYDQPLALRTYVKTIGTLRELVTETTRS
jgi:hypothetical protein